MESRSHFLRTLRSLDGKPYPAYRALSGSFDLGFYTLFIDHVQGDPYAPPSRIRAVVHGDLLRLSDAFVTDADARVAAEDFLTRRLVDALETLSSNRRGSGRSGVIVIDTPGQVVLARSSVSLSLEAIEVRLSIGLPADGRRIRAKDAEMLLLEDLPFLLSQALSRTEFPFAELEAHVALYQDQCYIREQLSIRGLVAFIGDGSVLARRSGVSELPMDETVAIPTQAPSSLCVTFTLPSGVEITGLGVAKGITLIVGGGFHGKSTLLHAVMHGVYNHIAGDGREWCITDGSAVKVRAEDGRRVSRVDISGFINNLPGGRSTTAFSTQDASGATSQAAAIVEAMELGARVLLIDEDTSATNFMIRDARMQRLIANEEEPITPFVDRVRELYQTFGVSSILVVGGSGDYLDEADTVLRMDAYHLRDMTEAAKRVVREMPAARQQEVEGPLPAPRPRAPQGFGVHKIPRIEARARHTLLFDDFHIDLSALEQLHDEGQMRAIAAMLRYGLAQYADGDTPLATIVNRLVADVQRHGFQYISPHAGCSGFYSLPRALEIGMVWNRVRGLGIRG